MDSIGRGRSRDAQSCRQVNIRSVAGQTPFRRGKMYNVALRQHTQLKSLVKGLLAVASCHWWGTGGLEILAIIGWRRLLISRVGVALVSIGCCLGRILHRRSRGILATALVIVGVCFSTLCLRHLWQCREG